MEKLNPLEFRCEMPKKKKEHFLDFWRRKRPDLFQKGGVLYTDSAEKVFSVEDLKKCFDESRLTNAMLGFKHDKFEDYLEWVKQSG